MKIGDTVCGISPNSGCYSSRIQVNQKCAVVVSDGSKKAPEIAASVINYVTAMELLKSILEDSTEKSVFIRGAAGGVGLAVLDICQSKSIRVYGSGSPNKRHIIEEKGAIFIDRSKGLKEQRSLFPLKGVDLVFDCFGVSSFNESVKLLGPKGRFVGYGAFGGNGNRFLEALLGALFFVRWKFNLQGRKISWVAMAAFVRLYPGRYRSILEEIVRKIESGTYSPGPIEMIPLSEAYAAHRKIENAGHIGKIILGCRESHSNI